MLPGTLGSQFHDEEMRIDLAALATRAGAKLIVAHAHGLDMKSGHILFSDHEPIAFDALSIGVGSMPAGWQLHSASPAVVPIKPMQTFLERLALRLQTVEQERNGGLNPLDRPMTRVAVVGGGVASVEIALCLWQQRQHQPSRFPLAIDVFTSSEHVAGRMTRRSVRKVERLLAARGIKVHCDHRIATVSDQELTTDDGKHYPADCVIWATGAEPIPLLYKLGLRSDSHGFIATHDTLQSLTDPRIFAVGDCGTVIDSPSPKAGVYAVRQCPVLWHNLRALFQGTPMRSFRPQADFLKLLNTGDGKALLEYRWLSIHAQWCLALKTWIDRRFIREFKDLFA